MDQTLHRVATKEREEIKLTTKQKTANDITKKEGTTWNRKATDRRRWKTLMESYILQWIDKAWVKGESSICNFYLSVAARTPV